MCGCIGVNKCCLQYVVITFMFSFGLSCDIYMCILFTHSIIYIVIFHLDFIFIYHGILHGFCIFLCYSTYPLFLFMFSLGFHVCSYILLLICSYILFYTSWLFQNICIHDEIFWCTCYILCCICCHVFSTFQSICTLFQSGILVFSLHNRDTLDLFCFEQRVVYPRELWVVPETREVLGARLFHFLC